MPSRRWILKFLLNSYQTRWVFQIRLNHKKKGFLDYIICYSFWALSQTELNNIRIKSFPFREGTPRIGHHKEYPRYFPVKRPKEIKQSYMKCTYLLTRQKLINKHFSGQSYFLKEKLHCRLYTVYTSSISLACKQALLFGQAKRASRASPAPYGFAARSRVLARLASLAQIGEIVRRLLLVLHTKWVFLGRSYERFIFFHQCFVFMSVQNPIVGVKYVKQADYTRGDNSENEQKNLLN